MTAPTNIEKITINALLDALADVKDVERIAVYNLDGDDEMPVWFDKLDAISRPALEAVFDKAFDIFQIKVALTNGKQFGFNLSFGWNDADLISNLRADNDETRAALDAVLELTEVRSRAAILELYDIRTAADEVDFLSMIADMRIPDDQEHKALVLQNLVEQAVGIRTEAYEAFLGVVAGAM